ncbi:hypothetical protein J4Q44_G00121470 [Coregonus suidteri]|uniref:Uncharacterized protein n=1 Tax=Coregonus suidteri TaxID=861788 RepID=A0AAN8R7P8_9TELE
MPSFRRKQATLVYRDLTRVVKARTPLPSTWICEKEELMTSGCSSAALSWNLSP